MPQAMERLLATPKMMPVRPSSNAMGRDSMRNRGPAAGRRLAGRRDGGVTIPPMKRLLFVLLLVAVPLAAQTKRAFTIEDFYRVRSLGDLSLSPDGRTLLFTVSTSDLPHAKRTTRL